MIIENIPETKRTSLNDLKHNAKRFVIFLVCVNIYLTVGALMFFYVEQCYDVVPESLEYRESGFLEICNRRNQMNNTNISSGDGYNVSSEVSYFLHHVEHLCRNDNTETEEITCTLDNYSLMKWFEFVFTVQYTIGMGNVVARSDLGKILTMLYGLPAITLTTASYVFCANMIISAVKLLIIAIEVNVCKHTRRIIKFQRKIIGLQVLFTLIFLTIYMAYFKSFLTHLNLLDVVYLAFTTFTTIGFGDISIDRKAMSKGDYFVLTALTSQVLFTIAFANVASLISILVNTHMDETPEKSKSSESILAELDERQSYPTSDIKKSMDVEKE